MHLIEPHYRWLDIYNSENDERSPFYGIEHSEFQFNNAVYNHYIHPQWDDMGSSTLFIRIIFCDYEKNYALIELIGEWNDLLHNDIMIFKRDVIDLLIGEGISKFIILGEHVMNFHASDDCYYEEWFDDVNENDGWIAFLDFRDHVLREMNHQNIDHYVLTGGELDELNWRKMLPEQVFSTIENVFQKRIN